MFPIEKEINYKGQYFKVNVNSELEDNFWSLYESGEWEPEIMNFYMSNVKGGYFLDIGSWIGPVSIPMSRLYEKVISIDFDPIAKAHLEKNIDLNDIKNIIPINTGLSDKREKIKLDESWFGSSETSIYHQNSTNGIEVDLITFSELINKIEDNEKIKFVKIDIEGGEFKILKDIYRFMNTRKVTVVISYHSFHLKSREWKLFKLVHSIKQLRYKKYFFQKDGSVQIIRPYDFVSLLKYSFPIGDVLES